MKGHRDNTSDIAVGRADREWRRMAQLALIIRNRQRNINWIEEKEKLFTGIFQRLLTDPIEEVEIEARR